MNARIKNVISPNRLSVTVCLLVMTAGLPAGMGSIPRIVMKSSPPRAVSPVLIATLLHRLSQGSKAQRQAAERDLIAMGVSADEPLHSALNGPTTPAFRHRLQAVLAAIARHRAVRGPLVRLDLRNVTLEQALRQVSRAGGFDAGFYPLFRRGAPIPAYFADERLTLKIKRRPFWQVLQAIARVTGTGPFIGGPGSNGLSFSRDLSVFKKGNPVCISGGFLISVGELVRTKVLHYDRPPANQHRRFLDLLLNAAWCPKGESIKFIGPIHLTSAVDNLRQSLLPEVLPAAERNPTCVNNSSSMAWTSFGLSCRLQCPSARADRITVLRGNIPVITPAEPVVYSAIRQKSRPMTVPIASLTLTFGNPVKHHPAQPLAGAIAGASRTYWTVPLVISAPFLTAKSGKIANRVVRQIADSNAVRFFDKADRPLQTSIFGAGFYAPLKHHYTFGVSGGIPASVRVTIDRLPNARVNVPFVFRNVPLPN